jgi:hypothetical protein
LPNLKIIYSIIWEFTIKAGEVDWAELTVEDGILPSAGIYIKFGERVEELSFKVIKVSHNPIKSEAYVDLSNESYLSPKSGLPDEETHDLFQEDMRVLEGMGWKLHCSKEDRLNVKHDPPKKPSLKLVDKPREPQ